MYIKVDKTPNEEVLKFSIGENFPFSGDYNKDLTEDIPDKIKEMLEIDGIESLLFIENFLSVRKNKDFQWGEIKPKILSIIVDILQIKIDTDISPIKSESDNGHKHAYEPVNDLEKEILSTIDKRIRPMIQSHGGNIEFFGLEDGVVKVRLIGACVGCPSSIVTLKLGIEKMLVKFFSEVKSIIEV